MGRIITITPNPAVDRVLRVDGFQPSGVFSGKLLRLAAAGKGINVSRNLSILGIPSTAVCFVGRRQRDFFEEEMPEDVSLIPIEVEADTRENVTILDLRNGGEVHIREKGFSVLERQVAELEDVLSCLVQNGDTVAVCGSLPVGLGIDEMVGILRRTVIRREANLVVDVSGGLLGALLPLARVAVPNENELREVVGETGGRNSLEVLCRAVKIHPGCRIFVTMGAEGACTVDEGKLLRGRPPVNVHAVSSVGCGDAFLAGLLQAGMQGQSTADALRKAVACSLACLSVVSPVVESAKDVEKWLQSVEVEEVEVSDAF